MTRFDSMIGAGGQRSYRVLGHGKRAALLPTDLIKTVRRSGVSLTTEERCLVEVKVLRPSKKCWELQILERML